MSTIFIPCELTLASVDCLLSIAMFHLNPCFEYLSETEVSWQSDISSWLLVSKVKCKKVEKDTYLLRFSTYQRIREDEAKLLRDMVGVQREKRFGVWFGSSHSESDRNPQTTTILRLSEWFKRPQPVWTPAQSSLLTQHSSPTSAIAQF